jgi:hypothetical protein
MSKQSQNPAKDDVPPNLPLEEQARNQTGQQRIRLRIDEKNLKTGYANGVRPIATQEEVILDFGLNLLQPAPRQKTERDILFQANERIIMSYYAAKRLAIALSQILKRYENEYGEIELNSLKRRKAQKT